jgi:hypothetical protein
MPLPSHSSRFYHPEKNWVRSTDHSASHYAASSTPLLICSSYEDGFEYQTYLMVGGPVSVVGIATGHGLDGTGIEFR